MLPDSAVLKDVACDYITAYAAGPIAAEKLHAVASSLYRHEAEIGNRVRSFGISGFSGFKCGEVEIGKRKDELLVRLHGNAAALSWGTLLDHADNCSRFDVQATVLVQGGVTKTIEKFRRAARVHSDSQNKKPIVRWVCDHRGGYTLYLGARQSDCFGRVYDKWQKTKIDYYKECVRFEVQYQDSLALRVASTLRSASSPRPVMSGLIQSFMERRGCRLELPGATLTSIRCPRTRPDLDRTLEWLQAHVRPSVLRLIDAGRGSEALTALGLVDETPE